MKRKTTGEASMCKNKRLWNFAGWMKHNSFRRYSFTWCFDHAALHISPKSQSQVLPSSWDLVTRVDLMTPHELYGNICHRCSSNYSLKETYCLMLFVFILFLSVSVWYAFLCILQILKVKKKSESVRQQKLHFPTENTAPETHHQVTAVPRCGLIQLLCCW